MKSQFRIFSLAVLALAALVPPSLAQNGKVALHVSPKQAYLYVDGQAISEASKHHTLSLSPGEHKIELINYGYALRNSQCHGCCRKNHQPGCNFATCLRQGRRAVRRHYH